MIYEFRDKVENFSKYQLKDILKALKLGTRRLVSILFRSARCRPTGAGRIQPVKNASSEVSSADDGYKRKLFFSISLLH